MSKQSAQDLLAGLDALPDDSSIGKASAGTGAGSGTGKVADDEASINEFLAEFGKERERPSRPITPAVAGVAGARAKAGSRNASLTPRTGPGARKSRNVSTASAAGDDAASTRNSIDSVRSRTSVQDRETSNLATSITAEDTDHAAADAARATRSQAAVDAPAADRAGSSGGGGWGSWSSSLWSTATSLQATIKSEAERRLQELQQSEEAKRLQARLRELDLAKLASEARSIGQRAIEAVAPPISRSEVLRVHVAHDLRGVRVEDSLNRAFERAMEQVEGGRWQIYAKDMPTGQHGGVDLDADSAPTSYAEAVKMCHAAVEALLRDDSFLSKDKSTKQSEDDDGDGAKEAKPTKEKDEAGESVIYISIQAFTYQPTSKVSVAEARQPESGGENKDPATDEADEEEQEELHLLLHLSDPANGITLGTASQGVSPAWLALSAKEVPETAYQPREWVADWCEDILTTAAGVLAQKYVCRRMGLDRWLKNDAVASTGEAGATMQAKPAADLSEAGVNL